MPTGDWYPDLRQYTSFPTQTWRFPREDESAWVTVGYDEAVDTDNTAPVTAKWNGIKCDIVSIQTERTEPDWIQQYFKSAYRRMQESMAAKLWPVGETERGLGERAASGPLASADSNVNPIAGTYKPPTHAHTLRLPTADTDARLGCARWWP